ncbi:kinase-like domain-containing protein [Mycena sp. CBHHK59/15]|nr:kinase-like domain-containing protein [Mycena sp. CBHHK59/15]
MADIVRLDRGYNNYLYTVKLLDSPEVSGEPAEPQPGTVPLPISPGSLLVRILKSGLPERVQNEVAALALVREPLRPVVRVPDVYAWSEGRREGDTPFIVMELLPGIPLDTLWPRLDIASRLPILSQIAKIFLTLQSTPLPVPLTSSHCTFGGLAFSESGDITTGVHPNSIGGPFASAEEQWRSMLSYQMRFADENVFVNGWRRPELSPEAHLRTRLDAFIDHKDGFEKALRLVATEPVFVHGDFNCRNLLICPETHRLTGLLDFEFTRIGTPPEEFLDSFEELRQHTCGDPPPDGLHLHLFEMNGWPCQVPGHPAELGCQTAKAWKDLVRLPMAGYEATAQVYSFLEKICP